MPNYLAFSMAHIFSVFCRHLEVFSIFGGLNLTVQCGGACKKELTWSCAAHCAVGSVVGCACGAAFETGEGRSFGV